MMKMMICPNNPHKPTRMNPPKTDKPQIRLRRFQKRIFWDKSGTIVLHWSRQIGKSHVLEAGEDFEGEEEPDVYTMLNLRFTIFDLRVAFVERATGESRACLENTLKRRKRRAPADDWPH